MAIEQTPLEIIKTIFSLELSKGHLKWSVSEVSRRTRLSRATIYYYLGTNKKYILAKALELICDEYYGLSHERLKTAKNDFFESARITRRLFEETPEFAVFYQIWRFKDSVYQKTLIGYEKKYRQKLTTLFPRLADQEITYLHASLHGLMTSPFLNADTMQNSLRILLQSVK